MFNLVHDFDGGRSVLCNDGKFHNVVMVGKTLNGRVLKANSYKTLGIAKLFAAYWNEAMADYCRPVAA